MAQAKPPGIGELSRPTGGKIENDPLAAQASKVGAQVDQPCRRDIEQRRFQRSVESEEDECAARKQNRAQSRLAALPR
jgi:hypothetical protein